ncbi:hypothetical protein LPJ53_000019 [Coemansia erecta]|uniref:Uncharacterized protein n=1 Tax=Coemansia erecta TaxID=147472 RepID=A0A9W8CW14_9FUNG|nr:hypothetical protein LPJ53_000019 [Coemansia erecta]
MPEDQKPQITAARYSLRTRTPVKASAPVPAPPTPTRRRRSRPSEAAQLAKTTPNKQPATKTRGRASSVPSSKRRANTASRRTRTSRNQSPTPGTDNDNDNEDDDEDDIDEAEMSSEDEEFSPEPDSSTQAHKKRAMSTASAINSRRGPGRPRKDGHAKRSRADDSSSRSAGWDTRRAPANLTKHDPFKVENLAAATHIMQQIPVKGTPNDDRYELMKMSDALKMCGFELGASEAGVEHLNEVYRLLSWAVHAAGPNGPAQPLPPLSEEAKGDLIRVFASVGRRIREETKDMAGYHRRHALRKLMLAKSARSESSMPEDGESKGNAVHRRNPLKVPGPLVDIWKVPYKKASGNDGNESPASDA